MLPCAPEWLCTWWPAFWSARTRWAPINPVAPVTSIPSFIRQELDSPLIEVFQGLKIIIRPPDVRPVAIVGFDRDLFTPREEIAHQIIKSVRLACRHQRKYCLIHHVDSHTDQILRSRLFAKAGEDIRSINVKDAIINDLLPPSRGNREQSLLQRMATVKAVQVQICQDVAVHQKKVVG